MFRARDLLSGEIVALKRIFVKQPQRGVGRSASNEVAVLRSVSDPHVVRLKDVHRQARKAFEGMQASKCPFVIYSVAI